MCRVLWIEDEADGQLANYVGPVISAGYDLDVELNVTDAIQRLNENEYDFVIFDLIINAGDDPEWRAYDAQDHDEKAADYLGLQLLKAIFSPRSTDLDVSISCDWLKPDKVAVFTVVTDHRVLQDLRKLGILNITTKASAAITALLDIINEKFRNRNQ